MVYYRKYRPQTISELDLSDVRERLASILSSDQIPHAFLFTGSRGLGKTSSARILAKAINCKEKSKSIEPCNECDICKSITEGSHIDVIEIDAASNRGVDEIRSLREKVKFSSSELSKKVYIIDEVHMLTKEAFNALLKTLEEPPEHVIFILATTEAHKIPQTILSRVFSIKFEKPTIAEITSSLKRVAKGEKLSIDKEVYSQMSRLSEGSFRDGAKVLEELYLSSDGGKIDMDLLEKVYKTGSANSQSEKLLESIYKKDMNASLKIIEQISNEGVDFKIVIEQMVEKLRDDLVSEKSSLSPLELKKILSLLNEAYAGVKFAVVAQLPLELAVVEWSMEKEQRVNSKDQRPKNKEQIKDEVEKAVSGKLKEEKMDNKKEIPIVSPKSSVRGDFLKDLIDAVHMDDRRVAAFLRSCKGSDVSGPILTITTPYSLHAEKLSNKEFAGILLKSAASLDNKIKEIKILTSA